MAVYHTPAIITISYSSSSCLRLLPSFVPSKSWRSNISSLRNPSFCITQLPTSYKTLSFFPLWATTPQKYVYPDPNPEFAVAETEKFREELKKKLYKERETFGDDLERVVDTCAEIFSEFLHKEYGGPGTLLVEPFTDMFIELKKNKLPGANLAARASLLWAQNYVDQDWNTWNS